MSRPYNFGAGPAMFAQEVLEQAQRELLNWRNTGMSVMEISHHSAESKALIAELQQDLRELLAIPSNYQILLCSMPARAQYAFLPMNVLAQGESADYVETGIWSKKAYIEAKRYADVHSVASSESDGFMSIPHPSQWQINPQARYLHYCDNETITGVEFAQVPDVDGTVHLACDMTSNFLSRPIDVKHYAVIYAGAQKNVAPAALTMVIIRDDFLTTTGALTPEVGNYQAMAEANSLVYTPNLFACYIASLTCKWIKRMGGIDAIAERNQIQAQRVYDLIDNSDFYFNPVAPIYRSRMNITFRLARPELESTFLSEADKAGLLQLKGHRFVGGMRASLYNSMPNEGVDALCQFMHQFEKQFC
ncbi:MAG: 3-phosphoserine/phosphohydroxythreonine transaminase [Gammaproteobacteria bacterium]